MPGKAIFILFTVTLLIVSCHTEQSPRTWYGRDTTQAVVASDSTVASVFDEASYFQQRESLLREESAFAVQTIEQFETVLAAWADSDLARSFWMSIRIDYKVVDVPLTLEIGGPEEPRYTGRAVIATDSGIFMVRSNTLIPGRKVALEYSGLTAEEFRAIMRRMVDEYRVFDLESDLSGGVGFNPAMTVLQVRYQGDSTLLLFAEYKKTRSDVAQRMFDYLDSLFWGE
ncbi:MAG: hypothetical protein AB1483_12285 [Candidatus Zixiibacteriota bacterium]